MDYYCDVCEKTINIEPKRTLFETMAHIELEKGIQTKHTIENLDFSDRDENVKIISTNLFLNYFLMRSFIHIVKLNYEITKQIYFLERFFLLWIE